MTPKEHQVVADMVEEHHASISDCMDHVNAERTKVGEETITESVVHKALKNMQPKALPVDQICQGSEDPHDKCGPSCAFFSPSNYLFAWVSLTL